MTDNEIRAIAAEALAHIRGRRKGHVYAARRGIVAAWHRPWTNFPNVAFRRLNGHIQMELWERQWLTSDWPTYPLPPDLEREAGQMLDDL